jgi:phospholipid/cholesterol/gamma-HCH transport system ATP-binding protein
MQDGALVRIEEVTKSFGGHRVLDRVELRVEDGESVAVLGGSGSGKTVLLKLIVGLLRPDAGDVHLWSKPISRLNEDELRPLRRRMGLVFQSGALFDAMDVFENVAFPLRELGELREAEIRARVEERLEWVGLPHAGSKRPAQLSGGMRKRVALARTISFDPELILYDEPTAGLDPINGRKISQLIRNLDTRLKSTSIVVTHDIECARTVADRWAFLSRGRFLADGTPGKLLESGEPEVREFLSPFATSLSTSGEPAGP